MHGSFAARIVAIDDSVQSLALLTAILGTEGFAVVPTACALDAFDEIDRQLPDLILLDIIMPDIDGYEVIARLKADERTHHIPIVMISALSDRSDRLRALEAGAADFISKPYDRAELLARVRTQLRLQQLHAELASPSASAIALSSWSASSSRTRRSAVGSPTTCTTAWPRSPPPPSSTWRTTPTAIAPAPRPAPSAWIVRWSWSA